MNYKVLYRKYRPDNFDNIIGQDYIIQTLINSVVSNNISHAYIFSGPRGTGKTSTAKVFAKSINCNSKGNKKPCGKCDFCLNFSENPDIIEIDAASNNGVDQIRELIDNVKLIPSNGKYKVYIIDEVHMLTPNAFNALLLTLEEPPSHVIFILATTNIENVPITILSRCQRFDFKKIDVDTLVLAMKNICKKEKISIEDDALREIAYLSDGGMRDSLSLLDQLSKQENKITLDIVENQIKTISNKSVDDLINLIEENKSDDIVAILDEFNKRSIDYKTLIKKIIDMMSIRAKNIKNTFKIDRLSFNDYKNMIFELSESITKVNINVDPYIILEMILLSYVNNNEKNTVDNIKMEKNIVENTPISENKTINKEVVNDYTDVINIRINNCFVNAKKEFLEEAKKMINKAFEKPNIDGKIKSIITDSTVVAASDKYIILSCASEHYADSANEFLLEFEKIINKENKSKYKVIFISEKRWNEEKNNYIVNLKNNKKYEMIEEKTTTSSTQPNISDVFDKSKVEIV